MCKVSPYTQPFPPQISMNVLFGLITVPLMLPVPTLLAASPVPVTRDTVEMVSSV